MPSSKVAVVRCESYDEDAVYAAVKRGISLIGGIDAFVRKGERILLKPNVLTAASPADAVTTHPAVFGAVAQLLAECGAETSYGDSPGFGKPSDALARCGLSAVAERFGLKQGDFERSRSVDFPDGAVARRFDVVNACLDSDGIISLPKMKTHALTRVTGAVKNQFGCVCGLHKAAFHAKVPDPVQFSRMLVDLNRLIAPRLFVMDGIMAMEGNGPRSGTPVPMNCLVISADPVAVDATFCRMVDLDPEFVPYLVEGQRVGLGNWRSEDIEYLGDSPDLFRKPDFSVVRKPVAGVPVRSRLPSFIRNAVLARPVIDHSVCVRCGVCVESCPVEGKALGFRDGSRKQPPVYTYSKCIRCYCCQEMCPYKAISVKGLFRSRR